MRNNVLLAWVLAGFLFSSSGRADFQEFEKAYQSNEAYDLSAEDFLKLNDLYELGYESTSYKVMGMHAGSCYYADKPELAVNGLLVLNGYSVVSLTERDELGNSLPPDHFNNFIFDPLTIDEDLPFLRRATEVKANNDYSEENGSDIKNWNLGLRVREFRKTYLGKLVVLETKEGKTKGQVLGYCQYTNRLQGLNRPNPTSTPIEQPPARKNFYYPCPCPGLCS